jgi:hypothetical protein
MLLPFKLSFFHNIFLSSLTRFYDSVRREVLYNILIEFGAPMILLRLIKMCLNEMYSKVRICKHLSDSFPIYEYIITQYIHIISIDQQLMCPI